jgi:hypothetical protein
MKPNVKKSTIRVETRWERVKLAIIIDWLNQQSHEEVLEYETQEGIPDYVDVHIFSEHEFEFSNINWKMDVHIKGDEQRTNYGITQITNTEEMQIALTKRLKSKKA